MNAVNEDGSTALLFAFNGKSDRAIQSLLLRSGADPGIDDGEGWNVYSAAAECGGPQEEYLRTGFVAELVAQIAALKETNATLEADLVAARAVERRACGHRATTATQTRPLRTSGKHATRCQYVSTGGETQKRRAQRERS